jgi:hypothetical protein
MAGRRLTCALAAATVLAALAPASAQDAAPAPAALSAQVATLKTPDDPTDRASYVRIVRREAVARGLPPEVAEAVAEIESGTSPDAVGGVGEIGLMQIRPATAAMLGHDGGALALFDPETNARFAVRYLAQAWKLAKGDLCRALMKYRAGHGAELMSPLSVEYCRRAKVYLAGLGSPLADGAAAPAVAAAVDVSGPRPAGKTRKGRAYLGWRPGRHTAQDNARFWAAHEARIKALEARIERRLKLRIARRG